MTALLVTGWMYWPAQILRLWGWRVCRSLNEVLELPRPVRVGLLGRTNVVSGVYDCTDVDFFRVRGGQLFVGGKEQVIFSYKERPKT